MSWFDDLFTNSNRVQAAPSERNDKSSSSSSSSNGAAAESPGTGVIDIKFTSLKTGGFKVWLFFWLLAEGKTDLQNQFTVRETSDGVRCFLTGSTPPAEVKEYEGVLDITWGTNEPRPFLRVDRIDPREEQPYPGELEVLCRLVDALMDLFRDNAAAEKDKLFTFDKGTSNELSDAKAKLAALAAKWE